LRTRRDSSAPERFVEFERINFGETRLSVGAVNVRSANFVYFDTTYPRFSGKNREIFQKNREAELTTYVNRHEGSAN
jgi:hypothetical protein